MASKKEFLAAVRLLYRVGNRATDREAAKEHGEEWTVPDMAGDACCALLDRMLTELRVNDVLTKEEAQEFYDDV